MAWARIPALGATSWDGQLRPFSNDIMSRARETTVEILQETAAADATYRTVYDHWRSFNEASYRWLGAAELRFAGFAFAEVKPSSIA